VHSLTHADLARTLAAERTRTPLHAEPARDHRGPPLRRRVAFAAARLAARLDADAARRGVA